MWGRGGGGRIRNSFIIITLIVSDYKCILELFLHQMECLLFLITTVF